MKTIKLFMMAALVLMTAACSSDDNDITTPTPQPVKPEGITITATLAPKNGGDNTRGLSVGTDKDKIVATWENGEEIAILYEVGGVKKKAEATVTAVNTETGAATIQFTVDANTEDNTTCTLVLPYTAAKDDYTGVKDAATLLAKQTGSITSEFMDVRVGAGKIQITNPGLTVTTQPAAQNAIFRIQAKKPYNSSTTFEFNSLTITIDGTKYVNIEKSPSSAQNDFYVALPPVSNGKVSFLAKDVDGNTYGYSKSDVTFEAGKYYQSTLKMMGAFSVGANKRVCFSQGNLQYQPSTTSTSTWKFADHQWDNLSFNCAGTAGSTAMDLFTWGNIDSPAWDGTTYFNSSENLSGNSDWGYNAISNGGNKNSQWRTLTIDEWNYLFKTRSNADSKYGFATVNDRHGIIIVPDGFSDPKKNNGSNDFAGSSTTGWNANIYTEANWTSMEEAGCVFLPAGGQRTGSSVNGYQTPNSSDNPGTGYYWSASCSGSTTYAQYLEFNGSSLNIHTTWTGDANKQLGYSVRLVRDL